MRPLVSVVRLLSNVVLVAVIAVGGVETPSKPNILRSEAVAAKSTFALVELCCCSWHASCSVPTKPLRSIETSPLENFNIDNDLPSLEHPGPGVMLNCTTPMEIVDVDSFSWDDFIIIFSLAEVSEDLTSPKIQTDHHLLLAEVFSPRYEYRQKAVKSFQSKWRTASYLRVNPQSSFSFAAHKTPKTQRPVICSRIDNYDK